MKQTSWMWKDYAGTRYREGDGFPVFSSPAQCGE